MKLSNSTLLALADSFFSATLSAETGVLVTTNGAFRCRMLLYRFRRELGNPEYDSIEIRISPDNPETDLWILRAEPPEPSAPEPSVPTPGYSQYI